MILLLLSPYIENSKKNIIALANIPISYALKKTTFVLLVKQPLEKQIAEQLQK